MQKTLRIGEAFLFFLGNVNNNVLYAAIKNGTEVTKRHRADGLVVLEAV